jgi:hypothetical protein
MEHAAKDDTGVHDAGTLVIGRIAPGSRPDRLVVDFAGNAAGGPLPARSMTALDAETVARAVRERQGAVLAFEGGDPTRPVLLGLLVTPSPSPLIDSVIDETKRLATRGRQPLPVARQPAKGRAIEAQLDDKRMVLEAQEEIVLRCGDASITLRRDGKLILNGAYIETRATGVNRIKGGAVKIN